MHQASVQFPERMDLPTIMAFIRELDYYAMHDRIVFNFLERTFFAPFAMLLISAKIKRMREKNPDLNVLFKNYNANPYLGHVGFYHMCGIERGREMGEAWGSKDYLPITRVERGQFYENPGDKYEELPKLIQRHAENIANVIARHNADNSVLYDVLSYSIREVMRNVFEHAQTNALYYCCQYWPRSNKVEFAIADFGVGIRRGLGENPNFRFNSDKEAIEYSLLPSVSGKTHLPRKSDIWHNTGYGLYMTSRFARNGGNFVIASGQMAIHLSRKTKHNYPTSFPGTALRFNLDVGEIGNVQARLDEFREDGIKIAQNIAGSANRPPSAMSLLLRTDYSGA
ncbi:hypothetical protein [Ferrovibrio sp.]|uniref:hypothetical protein n=1 Tax=Ferrovibrio sp. TaxID=1917215 RepID=UPI0035B3FD4A